MPIVTVSPIQNISVRIGPGTPAEVQSTSTFFGASDEYELIQQAFNTANLALTTANTALYQVNSAYVLANSAYILASNALPKSGGVITGNLTVDGTIYGNVSVIDAGSF